jgi:sirohydrochlorin ferrochelatase
MAHPAVRDVLPQLAAQGWQRVVIQPHLLFHGELYDQLRQEVQATAAESRQQEWIVTPYLAAGMNAADKAGNLLVDAVIQRFQAAAIRVVAPGGDG